VQARVAKGQHLAVVDMSKMPTANLNSDSLHPNDTGYAFMANVWYAAIQSYLPK
jgi:lysophospholipase L1-like esterase